MKITNYFAVAGLILISFAASARAENSAPVVNEPSAPVIGAPTHPPVPMSADNSGNGGSAAVAGLGGDGLPRPVQSGDVRYITGGIGDEERDALDAVKKDYNLHITSVDSSGAFLGDTQISIRDRKGDLVVKAAAGPMFYADLPAGSYTVEELSNGQTMTRKVTVGPHKSSALYLRWQG